MPRSQPFLRLNEFLRATVRVVGFLPTQVDRRLQMAQAVLGSLEAFKERFGIPILPEIRTDAAVPKSIRARKMLVYYDPTCRAMQ